VGADGLADDHAGASGLARGGVDACGPARARAGEKRSCGPKALALAPGWTLAALLAAAVLVATGRTLSRAFGL